ncbi:MAG: hypothetical protein ABEH64_09365 [Salinirussus sp.]
MDDQGEESMPERAAGSTWKLWFILEADRWVVAGLLSAALWSAILVIGLAQQPPLLETGDPVETLFQALVAATITAVTLVLTLSQLVLSQELGAAGDQRERMEGALAFRDDVAEAVGASVSPAEPSAFLRSLVDTTREHAEATRTAATDASEPLESYLGTVIRDADAVSSRLDGASFGTFTVVRAALDFDYSWKLHMGQRLLAEQGDRLGDDAHNALQSLVNILELFGPAREHIKTLYFQWELSNLSRVLLLSAIPALAVAVSTLVFFDPRRVSGSVVGIEVDLLVLATTVTLSLVPFTLLLAYILRIVTVTKRTLSIGPFILRETDGDRKSGRD